MVAIGELARRYKLSTEFVHSMMEQRIGTLVQGRLHAGLIFTAAFVGRIKCQVFHECLPCKRSLQVAYEASKTAPPHSGPVSSSSFAQKSKDIHGPMA